MSFVLALIRPSVLALAVYWLQVSPDLSFTFCSLSSFHLIPLGAIPPHITIGTDFYFPHHYRHGRPFCTIVTINDFTNNLSFLSHFLLLFS